MARAVRFHNSAPACRVFMQQCDLISPDSWLGFVHVSGIKLFSPVKPTKYLKAINNRAPSNTHLPGLFDQGSEDPGKLHSSQGWLPPGASATRMYF